MSKIKTKAEATEILRTSLDTKRRAEAQAFLGIGKKKDTPPFLRAGVWGGR